MSNRSLFEFNHDHAAAIEHDPEGFVAMILSHLRSGGDRPRDIFRGIRFFGMRHHSAGFKIKWGAHEAEESES